MNEQIWMLLGVVIASAIVIALLWRSRTSLLRSRDELARQLQAARDQSKQIEVRVKDERHVASTDAEETIRALREQAQASADGHARQTQLDRETIVAAQRDLATLETDKKTLEGELRQARIEIDERNAAVEALRRQFEEQKTVSDGLRRQFEEQKTVSDGLRRQFEEQKTVSDELRAKEREMADLGLALGNRGNELAAAFRRIAELTEQTELAKQAAATAQITKDAFSVEVRALRDEIKRMQAKEAEAGLTKPAPPARPAKPVKPVEPVTTYFCLICGEGGTGPKPHRCLVEEEMKRREGRR